MAESNQIRCGPFELEELVGSGGMGTVWRASDTRRGTPAAVKIISSESDEGREARGRFRREVQAHARLRHPSIATIYDYGEIDAETAERSGGRLPPGAPYLALEFAERGTLADGDRPSRWSELQGLLLEILDALAFAHARDVVHRDIKPGNVLLFGDGANRHHKLADFGVAYSVPRSRLEGKTSENEAVGTPEYMAPEQFRGNWRDFGPWTDLYAVGCLAYRLVCRSYPYSGETVRDLAEAHLAEGLPEVEPVYPVPRAFVPWLRRMMARSPALRFRRAADAARGLVGLPAVETSESPAGLGRETSSVVIDDEHVSTDSCEEADVLEPRQGRCEDARDSDAVVPPTRTVERDPMEALGVDEGPGAAGPEPLGEPPAVPFRMDAEELFPEDWSRREGRRPPDEGLETGWGMYGLREIPLVDRREERDAIWEMFGRVVEGGGPRAVVVEGRAGRGKSKLAEWVVRRAHEVGSFHTVLASWGRKRSHRQGLAELLERLFVLWDLDRETIYRRVRSKLRGWYPRKLGGGLVDRDARAVTELVEPAARRGDADRRYVFESDRDRFAVIERVLAARARDRPVALWLDDAHWGPRALDFADYLLESDSSGSIALLVTVRIEVAERRGFVRERVDELGRREPVTKLELQALREGEHAELLRRLLPLDDGLVAELTRRTAGNPLFAVQLVGDLVDRGFLQEGSGPLESEGRLEDVLPGHLSDLWRRRVERTAAEVGDESTLRAVEIAAALGEHVSDREWREACERSGVSIPERLVDELVARGLAHREPGGWRFAHGMLVDALGASASEAGRLRDQHTTCAEVVDDLYGRDRPAWVGRRAEHLVEAGEWECAVEPLLRAIRLSRRVGEFRRGRRLLEMCGRVLDRLGRPERHRDRVASRIVEARMDVLDGDSERAETLAREALEVAKQRDWAELAGRALECLAAHRKVLGELDASMDFAARAQEHFERVGDDAGWADAAVTWAHGLQCRSEHARARDLLQRARGRYREENYLQGELEASVHITYSFIYEGRNEEARRYARDLLERAGESGNADAEAHGWNQFGEIARFERRWGRARERYERAFEIWNRVGSNSRHFVRMNLAFIDLVSGRDQRAAEELERLMEVAEAESWGRMVPTLKLASVVCDAGRGGGGDWEDRLGEVRDLFREVETIEWDHEWLAGLLVDRIDAVQHPEWARRAEAFASEIRRARGEAKGPPSGE